MLGFALFILDVVAPIVGRDGGRPRLPARELALPAALAGWAVLSVLWTDSPTRTREEAV